MRFDRPAAIAHRGFSHRSPENTLAAFREALDAGATFVECDVHASAQGTPYVLHDPTLERTTNSSGAIRATGDPALDLVDAGSWKAPRYAGEKLPRLQSLLEFLRGRAALALEIKAVGIVDAVLDAIDDSDFPGDKLTIFAFEYETLLEVRNRAPALHCTFLLERAPADWNALRSRLLRDGIRGVGPGAFLVDSELVEANRAAGLNTLVWTVDEPAQMRVLLAWGVDAIISNRIDLALEAVEDHRRGA